MANDIAQQCQLLDNIRDRVFRLTHLSDELYSRSQESWARSLMSEFTWLGLLVNERVLPTKLVEASIGREINAWVVTLAPFIRETRAKDPKAYEDVHILVRKFGYFPVTCLSVFAAQSPVAAPATAAGIPAKAGAGA